jgi:hypothetical protein
MRYCLACHRLSSDGPLCTQCGRSFGGRLCKGKKHHLNPPDAQFCGQCGTTDLADATSYVPLGCSIRLLVWGAAACLLWWGGSSLLKWGSQGFRGLTGYRSPIVWLIEQSAHVLVVLFVFYFLSMFMPADLAGQFRGLISKLCIESLRFAFQTVRSIFAVLGRVLLRLVGGEKTRH